MGVTRFNEIPPPWKYYQESKYNQKITKEDKSVELKKKFERIYVTNQVSVTWGVQ